MWYLITAYNFHHRELNSAGFTPSPRGEGLVVVRGWWGGGGPRTIRDKLKRECCPPGILSQHQGASARLSFRAVFYFTHFSVWAAPGRCAGLQRLSQQLRWALCSHGSQLSLCLMLTSYRSTGWLIWWRRGRTKADHLANIDHPAGFLSFSLVVSALTPL